MATLSSEAEPRPDSIDRLTIECPKCHKFTAIKRIERQGAVTSTTISCSHCGYHLPPTITVMTGDTQN